MRLRLTPAVLLAAIALVEYLAPWRAAGRTLTFGLAAFLTFGQHPLYPVYATFPRIWGLDPLTDQLIAGLLMKLGGGLILWAVIATIFFRWYGQEQRGGWDALNFWSTESDVRAELRRG